MTGERKPIHDPKSKGRSAVSNGTALFIEADGRSSWAKRMRDIVQSHVSDLGGADRLTMAQKELVRRTATLGCQLEQMEGRLADGLEVDLDLYGRLAGHQRRILESLGIERRVPKDVTPTIHEYRAMRARETAS